MPETEQIVIKIDLPLDFMSACEMFDVDPKIAMQYFLDQVSIYFHLTKRCDSPRPLASTIFNEYLEYRDITFEPNDKTRQLNIDGVSKVLSLVSSEIKPSKKDTIYSELIDHWYDTLR